eukprot:649364-Hanusia_phi.AAC.5
MAPKLAIGLGLPVLQYLFSFYFVSPPPPAALTSSSSFLVLPFASCLLPLTLHAPDWRSGTSGDRGQENA